MANGFLRRRRTEEYEATKPAAAEVKEEAAAQEEAPITGETIKAPMGGRVIEVNVKAGDTFTKGKTLLVYEAMKMENDVTAPRDGVVKRVFVRPDQIVGTDAVLIEFE